MMSNEIYSVHCMVVSTRQKTPLKHESICPVLENVVFRDTCKRNIVSTV